MSWLRRLLRGLFRSRRPPARPARPRPTGRERVYHAYVQTDEWFDGNGYRGTVAYRHGHNDAGRDDVAQRAFAVFRDTAFPRLQGLQWLDEVLAACEKMGGEVLDIFLHEVAGHEVLEWGHDVDNTIMNGELRDRLGGDRPEDRAFLRNALVGAYDVIHVHVGEHPGSHLEPA